MGGELLQHGVLETPRVGGQAGGFLVPQPPVKCVDPRVLERDRQPRFGLPHLDPGVRTQVEENEPVQQLAKAVQVGGGHEEKYFRNFTTFGRQVASNTMTQQ